MDQIEKKIKDDLWVLNTMEVRRLRLYYGERQLASNFESFSAMVCRTSSNALHVVDGSA